MHATATILRAAADLIEFQDHLAVGQFRDAEVCYCILGAIFNVTSNLRLGQFEDGAIRIVESNLPIGVDLISTYNDLHATKADAVHLLRTSADQAEVRL